MAGDTIVSALAVWESSAALEGDPGNLRTRAQPGTSFRTATFDDPHGALSAAVLLVGSRAQSDGATFVSIGIALGDPDLAIAEADALATRATPGSILLSAAAVEALGRWLPDGMTLRAEVFDLDGSGLTAFRLETAAEIVPHTLPMPATRLIGRGAQLRQLRDLLGHERLITLTGPPGSGKTRLAIEVGRSALGTFPDGAWFVSLAPIQDQGLIANTVAEVLRLKEETATTITDVVARHLSSRDLLLILDNFEHVLEGAPLVANWLSAAPRLRIVVTSRAALHVSGEREHAVPPLGLPMTPEDHHARRTEAVALFIDRAQAVAPEFAVDDVSLPEIVRICRRLDGLPLALEIAAARIKLLPVAAIRRRLDDSLALLTQSARDVPERHRSLHAAVSWSYGLLTEPQQAAFRGLAIFRGGWDIEAAEAVALAATTLRADPLEVMASLLDENLIRRQPDTAGEPRYEMLETLREFGRERLIEAGEVDDTGERHARWFLELAERAEPALTGSQQAEWLDRLERDADNLRAALRWAVDRRDGDLGMRLAAALWRFWQIRAHISEGRQLLSELFSLGLEAHPRIRARALSAAGSLAYWQYDQDNAIGLYEASVALRRELGEPSELASGLYDLGHALTVPGWKRQDLSRGRALELEALELYRSIGDRLGEARVLWGLGWNSHVSGNYAAAVEELVQDVAMFRELGDAFGLGWALTILGLAATHVDRLDMARSSWREALAIFASADDAPGIDNLLDHIAWLAQISGETRRAARLAAAAATARGVSEGAIFEAQQRTEGRSTMGPGRLTREEFEAAWREGEAMSRAEAVTYALEMGEVRSLPEQTRLIVYALGSMRVERLSEPIHGWGGAKAGSRQAQAIFAFLFDRGDAGIEKDEATEFLWPDLPIRRGDLAFHRTLGGLRSVLERGRRDVEPIAYEGGRYRLAPGLVGWSDVAAFEESLIRAGELKGRDQMAALEEARHLYRGDLFDDCPLYGDSSLVEERRAYLRAQLEDLLVRLGDLYSEIPDVASATARYRQALSIDPESTGALVGILRLGSAAEAGTG